MKKLSLLVAATLVLHGCMLAGVRQQDLDAWVGVPVEALDTHSIFVTIPMYKSYTESGIEIRNYANGKDIAQCFGNASANNRGKYVCVFHGQLDTDSTRTWTVIP